MNYPLFPLSQPLFPEQEMALKIFEPRYLSLISHCLRNDGTFGVVQIREGSEVGQPPLIFQVGVEARIVDWSQLPNGMLGVKLQGARKFRVVSTRVDEMKVTRAEVVWLPDEPAQAVPDHFDGLAQLLEQLRDHPMAQRLNLPPVIDSRTLGWQLTKLLPMSLPDRVALLAMADPIERLQRLAVIVEKLAEGEE